MVSIKLMGKWIEPWGYCWHIPWLWEICTQYAALQIIQRYRDDPTTQEILADLSDQLSDDRSSSTNSGHKRSLSCESSSQPKRRKTTTACTSTFTLPFFSLDIEWCIKKDAFYTGPQRNELIREACTALYGYCRQQARPVIVDDKKYLALRLYKLAPKSLGDPGDYPEVIVCSTTDKYYPFTLEYCLLF